MGHLVKVLPRRRPECDGQGFTQWKETTDLHMLVMDLHTPTCMYICIHKYKFMQVKIKTKIGLKD